MPLSPQTIMAIVLEGELPRCLEELRVHSCWAGAPGCLFVSLLFEASFHVVFKYFPKL